MPVMDRLAETLKIQKQMHAVHDSRDALVKALIADLGTTTAHGLNLDTLSAFGREMVRLSAEFESLSAIHKEMMNR